MEKRSNPYRIIAGICFVGFSLLYLYYYFKNDFYFLNLLISVGTGLIGWSMFLNEILLARVGSIVCLIYSGYIAFNYFYLFFTNNFDIEILNYIIEPLFVLYYVLILLATFNKKNAKVWCIIAGIFKIIEMILSDVRYIIININPEYVYDSDFIFTLIKESPYYLLLIIGAFMLGAAINRMAENKKIELEQASNTQMQQ